MVDKAREDQILQFIEKHPEGVWIEKVAGEVGISRITASKYLTGLEASKKVIVQLEGQMKRFYKIPDTADDARQ